MSDQTVHYQVEFYSYSESRWVPLFGFEKSEREAKEKANDWLRNTHRRVVKVTKTTEVVEEIRL